MPSGVAPSPWPLAAFPRSFRVWGCTAPDRDGTAHANSPSPGGGHGLIGMRERARSAGGRIRAGRLAQGGLEAAVELPYHSDGHPQEAAV
ncbi:ATP-binding protein [Streptomyces canus]|uniref:ATP-binding protein n=1 Tax=Streptomyces canus TaxID=58343 RepID=UPI000746CCE0|nr:hypothetical protein AQI96_33670 [Streptomyces canus]